jgi:VIT1/CCC1 family predicted Fe2+/Mn2+ transporter
MTATPPDRDREARIRSMLEDELEAAWLYDRLADGVGSESTARVLHDLAQSERQHAAHWAERLDDTSLADAQVRPSPRTRLLGWLGCHGGLSLVVPRLRAEELQDIRRYQAEPESGNLAEEEREHRAVLGQLAATAGIGDAEHGFASPGAASTFRAALFGLNDGIVSNLSLVAGVAGAAVESDAVLIAGIAGWLAGAFSMAAGEYVSVRSQTELFENQIARERLELELDPEDERAELFAIYKSKGISDEIARQLVDELMKDPDTALDTHIREELGLNPDDLGSAWMAAGSSFVAFTLGAIVPVIPFMLTSGYDALIAAIIAGAVMLAVVGMSTSLLTGRHPLFAGGRMLFIGLAATGITFGIGSVIPVDL